MYPITFIPVSLFLVYAVADCVLPTCPGLKRLLILCIRRPFFPSSTFFSGYFCTFLCFLTVLHCARSRSGGVRRVVFLQTCSCFCSVLFLSPPLCGGAVGGVPSVGDLHPTDKINCNYFDRLDTLVVIIIVAYNTNLCCAFSLSLWYFGCLCLAHSDHPPKLIFSKCIAPYRCDTVKVPFCTSYRHNPHIGYGQVCMQIYCASGVSVRVAWTCYRFR